MRLILTTDGTKKEDQARQHSTGETVQFRAVGITSPEYIHFNDGQVGDLKQRIRGFRGLNTVECKSFNLPLPGSTFPDKLRDALDGDLQLVHPRGVTATDVAFAAGAEGGAGHDGDLLRLEQAESKIV